VHYAARRSSPCCCCACFTSRGHRMFLMRAETPQVERGSPDQLGLKRGTEKPDLVASVLWPPRRIVAARSAKTGRETLAGGLVHFCAMVTLLYHNRATYKGCYNAVLAPMSRRGQPTLPG
jgi:hypothetical protein